MFERNNKPSVDPLPSTQHADRFLAAQAERLANRFTIDHQLLVSTLPELFMPHEAAPVEITATELKPEELRKDLIEVITRVHSAFMRGYKGDTQHYDPFDDQSLVSDEQFIQLTPDEQQTAMEFLQHLKAESRSKHLAPEYIGMVAVRNLQSH